MQEVLSEGILPHLRGYIDYYRLCSGVGLRDVVLDILRVADENDVVVYNAPNEALWQALIPLGAIVQISSWTSGTGVDYVG